MITVIISSPWMHDGVCLFQVPLSGVWQTWVVCEEKEKNLQQAK